MSRHHANDVRAAELWTEYRRAQQQRRAERMPVRQDEIRALNGKGYDVREMTAYQFRINGELDLYPIHRRFHHIPSNKRGGYQTALACAVRWLKGGRA